MEGSRSTCYGTFAAGDAHSSSQALCEDTNLILGHESSESRRNTITAIGKQDKGLNMKHGDHDTDIAKTSVILGCIAGHEARKAADIEHNLTFYESLKLYPTAIGWSIFFSLGVIMTAFDPQLLGNLYATPAFQRDFGYLYEGSYIVSAPWQTGLLMGSPIGQVVGAFFASYPMEW